MPDPMTITSHVSPRVTCLYALRFVASAMSVSKAGAQLARWLTSGFNPGRCWSQKDGITVCGHTVSLYTFGRQLALDGLHVEVFVDVVNFAILNMKDEAAEEIILLPGSNLTEGKSARLVSVPDVRYSRDAYSSFANRFTSVLILPGEAAQWFAANLAISSFP